MISGFHTDYFFGRNSSSRNRYLCKKIPQCILGKLSLLIMYPTVVYITSAVLPANQILSSKFLCIHTGIKRVCGRLKLQQNTIIKQTSTPVSLYSLCAPDLKEEIRSNPAISNSSLISGPHDRLTQQRHNGPPSPWNKCSALLECLTGSWRPFPHSANNHCQVIKEAIV